MRNWHVRFYDGTVGLHPEDVVIQLLRSNATIAAVAYEGSSEWLEPRRYAPFAEALAKASATETRTPRALVVGGSCAAAACALACAFLVGRRSIGPPAVAAAVSIQEPRQADGSAAAELRSYLAEKKCEDRARHVLWPELNAPVMAKYYAQRPGKSCGAIVDRIVQRGCDTAASERYCSALTMIDNSWREYELRRGSGSSFMIDWRASTAFNEMPVITFRSTHDRTSRVFRLSAKLTDYYNYEFSGLRKELLAVKLAEQETHEEIVGYFSRERDDGRAIGELLADGGEHRVTVRLQYSKMSTEPSVAMGEFLRPDWHQAMPADP